MSEQNVWSKRGRGRGQASESGRGRGQASESGRGRGQASESGRGRGQSSGRGRGAPPPTQESRGVRGQPTKSSLEEEFPKLGVSTPPRPAWGAAKSTPVQQPQQQQQQMVKETIVEEIPPMPEPLKEETQIEEEKAYQKVKENFPPKPTVRGTEGRPIKIRTNHYRLDLKNSFTVYQYDVEMRRKSDKNLDKKLISNKTLMKKMFAVLQTKFTNEYKNKIVYNFSKNLYSLIKLPFEKSATYELTVENSVFLIDLKTINQVTVEKNFYQELEIQILDLIMTLNLSYSHINVNRSFFLEGNERFELGFGVDLWKGAYSSVRPSELGLTWNIDSANAAFLLSKDIIELALTHYGCQIKELKNAILKDKRDSIIGYSFVEAYKNREIKTKTGGFRKKIRNFGPDPISHRFEWNKPDGTSEKVSIAEYLKKQYGTNLKFSDLPCIDLGNSNYLPMELCSTELKNKKKLDETETQAMIKNTAVPAPDRMKYINGWVNNSNINKDPVLKEYNINVDLRMVEIDGRVLQPPDVEYKGRKITSKDIGEKGQWDHRNSKFYQPIKIDNWIVVNFAFRVKNDALDRFIDQLIIIGEKHGIYMADPLDVINETRRMDDNMTKNTVVKIMEKYRNIQLIVVIFDGSTNAYKIVKTQGDLINGIATQGVKDKNVNRINDQTISNILLKINCKVGGTNFVLSSENRLFGQYIQKLFDGPLMIFGADVTHPAPGENSDSIAAVVGSMDKQCCYYAARLYAQKSKKGQAYEMIHNLDEMFFDLLNTHAKLNQNRYPKKIVFYRDGVSEGQFSLVLRHEINKMREACMKINPAYKPGITFVVVQKRHHTRLFPVNPRDENGRSRNVPPGTVVDRDIVTKNMFDFFLCSHMGIQGTSRPCRYFLLHDDNQFTMNQLQILSHYLCHVYARCPRSVSYPASAYYSHLAAFRGRDYIRRPLETPGSGIKSSKIPINDNIKNKMFFI